MKTDRFVTKLNRQHEQEDYITDCVLRLLFSNFTIVIRISLVINIKHRLYTPGVPLLEIEKGKNVIPSHYRPEGAQKVPGN